jgi:cytochrome c oxidase subunit 1
MRPGRPGSDRAFTGGGPPDTGWTFYAPYNIKTGTNVSLAVFAVFVLGLSSILPGINFVTTTHRMRAPGMSWYRLPLFVWAIYATAWIQVLATPVLGVNLLLVLAERLFGIGVFDLGATRSCITLFWIYFPHPGLYHDTGHGGRTEIIPVSPEGRYSATGDSGRAWG